MLLNVLIFVAGVAVLQTQAQLPPPALALLLIPGAAVAFALSRLRFRIAASGVSKAIIFFAGFFWAALFAHLRLANGLPESLEGVDVELTGVLSSLPHTSDIGTRFDFDVERASEAKIPSRLSLSWYRSKDGALPEIHAGQRWTLVTRLKRPHGTYNPHGFDYEAWLLERNIRATGYVREHAANRLLGDSARWLHRTRERIRENFYAKLEDAPYAGVLVALAIGDQRAIPKAQWEVFTRTGVNHLMSMSCTTCT
jgi:competence protein ComEC